MQSVQNFYTKNIDENELICQRLKQNLSVLSIARLFTFIALISIPYLLRSNIIFVIAAIVVFGAVFLVLIKKYIKIKQRLKYHNNIVAINAKEIRALQYNFEEFPDGKEYLKLAHCYSQDLDLFGDASFYQYINRATLKEGEDAFAALLLSNTIANITSKQEAIKEIADKAEWRQTFSANAMFIENETRISSIVHWLESYTPFVPKIMRYLPFVILSVFSVVAVLTFFFGWLFNVLFIIIGIGLTISGFYFKHIQNLSAKADKVKSVFKQYATLLKLIEQEKFTSKLLKQQQQKLAITNSKASSAIAKFSKLLDVMDYNNNVFYIIFGNGCYLGALKTAYEIEKWLATNKNQVADWFNVISFFEGYNSLGNFAFNHPYFNYPSIKEGAFTFKAKELGHPLIAQEKIVKNDFEIDASSFHIITGSNMAGKSTFLRSVGLGIFMANLGLPICASSCIYAPIKLVTSMRSVDSLKKGDSYFFAELKRLKMVVELVKSEPYFVLLDEILRGTNSYDKATGSKQIVARLLNENATGLIATHDLSLCDMANENNSVKNYHLDATIKNNTLSFDYRLKKGVSKTMNASFMLKQMDLI